MLTAFWNTKLTLIGAGGSKNSIVGPNKFCGAVLNFDMAATTINEPIIGKLF